MIYNVDDTNYEEFISFAKDKIIVLDFYTNRCGFCKLQDLIIDSLHEQTRNDGIIIAKVDCDLSYNLVDKFVIQSLPTIIIIKNDEIVAKLPGISNEEKILDKIKNF